MDIDDLLKQGAKQPEFEFKDAYWADASAKLDAHYYRILLVRIGLGLVFLLLALTGVYYYYTKIFIPGDTSISQSVIAFSQNKKDAFDSSCASINKLNSNTDIQSKPLSKGSYEMAGHDVEVKIRNVNKVEVKQTYQNQLKFSNIRNSAVLAHAQNQNLDSDIETGSSAHLIDNTDEAMGEMLSNSPLDNVLAEQIINEKQFYIEKNDDGGGISYSHNPHSQIDELEFLPSLNMGEFGLEPEAIEFSNKLIFRSGKYKPNLRTYLLADLISYPALNVDGRRLLGGNFGLSFRYYTRENFFVGTGLTVGVRTGSFDPSTYSTQRTFLFGPKDDAFVTRPEAIFHFNIPLRVGYVLGKNEFYAGVVTQILAGVYGQLQYGQATLRGEQNTVPEFTYSNIDRGWMNRSGFRPLVFAGQIGYGRRLHQRTTLGVHLNVIPKDWLSDQYGQYFDFDSNQFAPIQWTQRGLVEQNWLLSFFVIYRL
jgi:hypothetical protein